MDEREITGIGKDHAIDNANQKGITERRLLSFPPTVSSVYMFQTGSRQQPFHLQYQEAATLAAYSPTTFCNLNLQLTQTHTNTEPVVCVYWERDN